MGSRMSPVEKFKHYEGQSLGFEKRRGWALGRYTVSEYLFLFLLGLWLAFVLPLVVTPEIILSAAMVVTLVYVLY
ncbi:MAG: hypothetical protein AABY11_02235, partial [archaeon]